MKVKGYRQEKEVLASSDSEDEEPELTLDNYVCKWAPGMYAICVIHQEKPFFHRVMKELLDTSRPLLLCKILSNIFAHRKVGTSGKTALAL
jgi:hypothetical protein